MDGVVKVRPHGKVYSRHLSRQLAPLHLPVLGLVLFEGRKRARQHLLHRLALGSNARQHLLQAACERARRRVRRQQRQQGPSRGNGCRLRRVNLLLERRSLRFGQRVMKTLDIAILGALQQRVHQLHQHLGVVLREHGHAPAGLLLQVQDRGVVEARQPIHEGLELGRLVLLPQSRKRLHPGHNVLLLQCRVPPDGYEDVAQLLGLACVVRPQRLRQRWPHHGLEPILQRRHPLPAVVELWHRTHHLEAATHAHESGCHELEIRACKHILYGFHQLGQSACLAHGLLRALQAPLDCVYFRKELHRVLRRSLCFHELLQKPIHCPLHALAVSLNTSHLPKGTWNSLQSLCGVIFQGHSNILCKQLQLHL
mmetsp:Transcript_26663/g.50678  ORF Transcript_26663/g.50678 Transcript_26663/m.50678 type:complete len:368 (-) Transcript_26663:186-1289(-)